MTTIIAGIEKDIFWDRATKDYACYVIVDGERIYLGNTTTRSEAEQRANGYAYDHLIDTHTYETAAALLAA